MTKEILYLLVGCAAPILGAAAYFLYIRITKKAAKTDVSDETVAKQGIDDEAAPFKGAGIVTTEEPILAPDGILYKHFFANGWGFNEETNLFTGKKSDGEVTITIPTSKFSGYVSAPQGFNANSLNICYSAFCTESIDDVSRFPHIKLDDVDYDNIKHVTSAPFKDLTVITEHSGARYIVPAPIDEIFERLTNKGLNHKYLWSKDDEAGTLTGLSSEARALFLMTRAGGSPHSRLREMGKKTGVVLPSVPANEIPPMPECKKPDVFMFKDAKDYVQRMDELTKEQLITLFHDGKSSENTTVRDVCTLLGIE